METYSKRPRRIPRHRPPPTPVKRRNPFIRNELEESAAAQRVRVGLHFDFEHVERKEDDFADTGQTMWSVWIADLAATAKGGWA